LFVLLLCFGSEQSFSMDISSDEADDWFMASLNTWVRQH